MNDPRWYSAHTHSKFSTKDALPSVSDIVKTAAQLGYPALGLTDHGTMAGTVQLYKNCRKAGINPLPGVEAYVAFTSNDKRPHTWHMGVLATSEIGYQNLCGLTTATHTAFKYKPILDLGTLATFAENGQLDGLACMTGCWFGLIPTMLREHDQRSVLNIIKAFDGWFGSGCYVELQNHAVKDREQDDEALVEFLYHVAIKAGLPVVITQDSHYCHQQDREHHDNMKRLMSWSEDAEDAIFPGSGYHMADLDWMAQHHPPHILQAGLEGLADLNAKANVRISELEQFQLKVPDITSTADPDTELAKRVTKQLMAMIESGQIKQSLARKYSDRVDAELTVVLNAGFAGYMMFAAHVTDWMRSQKIEFMVRGSASGSILCWLLGVSELDPIFWGLSFERFLSSDRAKPPDIDIDVEDRRREEAVDWLLTNYLTFNISTWSALKISDKKDQQKGSLVVRWKTLQRRTGKPVDALIPKDEWDKLVGISNFEPYSGYGVHAAGLMIAPDEQAASRIPLQYVASSSTYVTAYDKYDVEAMGMLKLDLLGVKTLSAVRDMATWSGVDTSTIPLNDHTTYAAMRKGHVMGAFQLDGGSSRRGIIALKPTKISDVIAAMALFRPATMQSGATEDFIARRHKEQPVPVRHPILAEETKDTYGVILFQDQALNIMKRLGLTVEEIEKARAAIKASNAEVGGARHVMDGLIAIIKQRATDLSQEDLTFVEQALSAYSGYGFNKAHATSYGLMAYITTWFSVHHPVCFWAALLNAYVGDPEEAEYLQAARKYGVKIRPAHINKSKALYYPDVQGNAIRKGLQSIKGVGVNAAAELAAHQPYLTLSDLATKVNGRVVTGAKDLRSGHSPSACKGIIGILAEAGALEGVPA